MTEERIGALLVTGGEPRPAGIVTERDLLRASTDPATDPDATGVSTVMSAPVQAMPGDEMIYRALGRMDRLGVRHLCVVDRAGAAIGMVSQRDLLHHRASAAAELGDAVACAGDAAALAAAHSRLPEVAAGLVAEGLAGDAVARVVSNELRALTGRAASIAVERLERDGFGPPPAPWCVLVLGSGGRGESLLSADQDNALVHAGADDDDEWFATLGAHLEELLDEAGVRRCQGGIMVSNPEWRGTAEAWRERVAGWLRRSTPDDLLHVDIFYDLVPVAGAAGLGRELHTVALDAARRSPVFLALLAESVAAMTPPVGLFGRLRAIDGRVDLKMGGLLAAGRGRTHPRAADRLAGAFDPRAHPGRERGGPGVVFGCADAGADPPHAAHPDPGAAARGPRRPACRRAAASMSGGSRVPIRARWLGDLRVLDDTLKVLRPSIAG